jgi:hypothetical protein
VGAERLGDGAAVTAVERLDRVGDLAGLGQHLEGDRGDLVIRRLDVDPNLGKRHVSSLFSQRTLRPSRYSTILA